MSADTVAAPNVKQAVPFFGVKNIAASLAFYVDGLGFTMTNRWSPEGTLGLGVSVCFVCADALAIYHQAKARGLAVDRPFVGNKLWDVALRDPDGYHIHFESPTDVPEDTVYEG